MQPGTPFRSKANATFPDPGRLLVVPDPGAAPWWDRLARNENDHEQDSLGAVATAAALTIGLAAPAAAASIGVKDPADIGHGVDSARCRW